jgi:hypothetical protein
MESVASAAWAEPEPEPDEDERVSSDAERVPDGVGIPARAKVPA